MLQELRIILSGGGTGGHIFPAIAIANEIKKRVPDAEILFVGAEGRMEMEKVPAAGYKIIGLWISGLQRKLTWTNLSFPFKVVSSLLKARKIIKEFKPTVVIGTGGYASGPLIKVACSKSIPALIQEQNSYPGITNKVLAKQVNKICVAYEGLEKYFPAHKICFTGNPVRQDILELESKKQEAYRYFQLDPAKKTLLVIGGSLGARSINQAIAEGLTKITGKGIQVLWQTGKNYIAEANHLHALHENAPVKIHAFITKMDYAYAIADCVVSRAGAGSISELCIAKKPCVLVPSPNVAEDHQTKNAMALVQKKAAILVKDKDAKHHLADQVVELFKDEKAQLSLALNIAKLALPDATGKIADEILKLSKAKN